MDNVVINFTGSTDGLAPVEAALDNILAQAGDIGEAWQKTSATMVKDSKNTETGVSKLASSIEKMDIAAKSLDKVAIGGAYREYLAEIQQQLGLTTGELIKYVENARKSAQEFILTEAVGNEVQETTIAIEAMNGALEELHKLEKATAPDTKKLEKQFADATEQLERSDKQIVQMAKDLKQLTADLKAANDRINKLTQDVPAAAPGFETLSKRLAEAKKEYQALIETGVTSGPEFEAARDKVGELANAMGDLNDSVKVLGSSTPQLDAFISLASGVAGGFAVMQGGMALFGTESEEVQQALLKVNAAMAILQGLQEVSAVLSKTSAISMLFRAGASTVDAAATTANTVATVANTASGAANIVVTNSVSAATVAEAAAATAAAAAIGSQTGATVALTVAQGAQTVATEGATVAQGAQTVATEGATVATAQLNATMALNPVFLIVAGIVALVAAFSFLNSNTAASNELIEATNDALQEAGDFLEEDIKSMDRYTNKLSALAKQRGAVAKELMKLDIDNGNDKLKLVNEQINALGREYNRQLEVFKARDWDVSDKAIEAHAKLLDRQLELQKKYQEDRNALEIKAIEYRTQLNEAELRTFIMNQEARTLATVAGSQAERDAQIREIRNTQAARITLAKQGATDEAEAAAIGNKIIAQDNREIQGINLKSYQVYLKSRTSLFEAYAVEQKTLILRNQVDSIASINALRDKEIEALKKRRDEALKSDPNITRGDTKKVIADTNLAILELEKENQAKLLAIQKAGINAKLLLAMKGTKDEYELKLAALDVQQNIELSAAELTAEQVAEIRARREKAGIDALRAFTEQQIQNQIDLYDAELNEVDITEQKKLGIVLQRLEKQRELELSGAAGNAAKIAEINSKFDKEILENKRTTANAILALNLRTLEVFSFKSIESAKRVIEKATFTDAEKIAALQRLQAFELEKLDLEESTLKKLELNESEYNLRHQDILNRRGQIEQDTQDKITEIHKAGISKRQALLKLTFDIFREGLDQVLDTGAIKTALNEVIGLYEQIREIANSDATDKEKRNAMITASILTTQAVINQVFADAAAQRARALEEELSAIEAAKQQELSADNLTAQQKNDINNRYREKERAAKRQAWIADRDAKKSQAVINGLLAAVNALATYPWPYSMIVAGIVAGLAAVEVGQINSVAVPAFRKGKINIDGPGTGTSDSIPARISKGESVITAEATNKWEAALQAINSDTFEDYLADYLQGFVFPVAPADGPTIVNTGIDYEKLAVTMADKLREVMPEPVNIYNTIDSNGLHQFIETQHGLREYLSNRYSMTDN